MYSKSFDNLQFFPNLVITPLTFLGGAFYSISKLPEFFQNLSLLNPLFYFIDFFRWTLFGINEVSIIKSLFIMLLILVISFIFTLDSYKKRSIKNKLGFYYSGIISKLLTDSFITAHLILSFV